VNFAGNGSKEKASRYRGAVAASVTQATVVLTFRAAWWLVHMSKTPTKTFSIQE